MTPGIYAINDIPMSAYLADPCPIASLSSSAAITILRSPAHCHAQHPRLGGGKGNDSNAADTGSVAHDLLFGGEGKICMIDPKDYPSKAGDVPIGWTNSAIRAARDLARSNGLTPILASAMGAIRKMRNAAVEYLNDSDIAGVLEGGNAETTLIWQEGDHWFRARPDWLRPDLLLHYKTTKASAAPDRFGRSLFPAMGYDMAMAFYRRGCKALGLNPRHVMLVQEHSAPYACSLVTMSEAGWAVADAKVERAVLRWKMCMQTNNWPAYSGSVHEIEPTAWALAEVEAALVEGLE